MTCSESSLLSQILISSSDMTACFLQVWIWRNKAEHSFTASTCFSTLPAHQLLIIEARYHDFETKVSILSRSTSFLLIALRQRQLHSWNGITLAAKTRSTHLIPPHMLLAICSCQQWETSTPLLEANAFSTSGSILPSLFIPAELSCPQEGTLLLSGMTSCHKDQILYLNLLHIRICHVTLLLGLRRETHSGLSLRRLLNSFLDSNLVLSLHR